MSTPGKRATTPAALAAFLAELEEVRGGAAPFEAALARILRELAAESGTLHTLEAGRLVLRAHSPGIPPAVLEVIREIPVGKGMAGLAVERCEPVSACNLQTDSAGDVRPGARATGLRGSIVVPMLRDGTAVGALGVANQAQRTFTEAEIKTLMAAGRALANWSSG